MRRSLALFDEAAKALAQCTRVDEAKSIRDKAVAMQTYATQAKRTDLIEHATVVRVQAGGEANQSRTIHTASRSWRPIRSPSATWPRCWSGAWSAAAANPISPLKAKRKPGLGPS